MERGHRMLEAALGLGSARHGEVDAAEPPDTVVVGSALLRACMRGAGERREGD
jgi:hypothetical protein